ncbi:MAG: 50S ribosomal protein L19 [Verrucomicrobia bacterium]|nr:50S ribosomal protein L19 [Verrucomicrobiota bacterium]
MSNHPLIQFATQPQLKTARGDHEFKVGDGVKVATKVREGDKERTQTFSGIVIQRKGGGIHETFTVRRVSFGEGARASRPPRSKKSASTRPSTPPLRLPRPPPSKPSLAAPKPRHLAGFFVPGFRPLPGSWA